jgi:hypothetical protein
LPGASPDDLINIEELLSAFGKDDSIVQIATMIHDDGTKDDRITLRCYLPDMVGSEIYDEDSIPKIPFRDVVMTHAEEESDEEVRHLVMLLRKLADELETKLPAPPKEGT